MAWCLMAPSHYLNQCWLLICEVLWYLHESNFIASVQTTILYNEFEIILQKLLPHLPGTNELNSQWDTGFTRSKSSWECSSLLGVPTCCVCWIVLLFLLTRLEYVPWNILMFCGLFFVGVEFSVNGIMWSVYWYPSELFHWHLNDFTIGLSILQGKNVCQCIVNIRGMKHWALIGDLHQTTIGRVTSKNNPMIGINHIMIHQWHIQGCSSMIIVLSCKCPSAHKVTLENIEECLILKNIKDM